MTIKRLIAVAAASAVLTVAGGIARAAVPADDGTITACYSTDGNKAKPAGALRVVDAVSGCGRDERPLAWSQRGPAGPVGPSSTTQIDAVIIRDESVVVAAVGGVDLIGRCQRDPNSLVSTPITQLSIGGGTVPVDATITGVSSIDDGIVESDAQPIAALLTGRYLDGLVRAGASAFAHFTLRLVRFDGTACRIQGVANQP
jgi:hypothetical protein